MEPASPLAWTPDGQPRSRLYDDVYFSAEDGLAESRAVFLQGCGLPDAFAGRRRFVVGELGFGSGLNIVALLHAWRRARTLGAAPPDARLHVFTVEAHPLGRDEAARALAPFSEVAKEARALLARWPGRARGFHRLELADDGLVLDLAVMDVAQALAAWTGQVDAWFLDGFSPARNPAMWAPEVMALVAARSGPGARAATFTVAGEVRRGLAAAGFAVEKRPGFGRKRERLEARLGGTPKAPAATRRVAIIGGGIAGAAAARAVRALGGEAVLVEGEALGAGGSGNPSALVTPRLDAGLGPAAALFAQALSRARALYGEVPGAVLAEGVLQLAQGERDLARFARIAAADLYEPDAMAMLQPGAAADLLGEPGAPAALEMRQALVVQPAAILQSWAGQVLTARAAKLEPGAGGWRVADAQGGAICEAQAVVIAAAMGSAGLIEGLPLSPVRGQASWAAAAPPPATAFGGYAVPTPEGVLFGATHDRGDAGTDLRPMDHGRNLDLLARGLPGLAAALAEIPHQGRASVRATTPDRLPMAGAAGAPGLFLLTGFGSRGFAAAPLLAEHVAALALGAPSPLPAVLAETVDPARFARRAARRAP